MSNRPGVVNKNLLLQGLSAALIGLLAMTPASARGEDDTIAWKARLSSEESPGSHRRLNFAPLALQGGSKLTLISPQQWSDLAGKLSSGLEETHHTFSEMFGAIPAFTTSLRLMEDETFYAITGAPRWTNAMYYKGQIIIPLSPEVEPDVENVFRSLRHEYAHAVLHALSGGKLPGWFDEGFAQWVEGAENPALLPALRDWLEVNPPVPLNLLQGGFTRLETPMVPAAYAQSLFATSTMINSFGFKRIRSYFDDLRNGIHKSRAFERSFNLSEHTFEKRLGKTLATWLKSGRKLS